MRHLIHNICLQHYRNTMLLLGGLPVSPLQYMTEHGIDEDRALENRQALDGFLKNVERRAYRMAELATGDADRALEIVQDAMFALVRKYSHKDESDWEPLFYRILQSKIRDSYRRSKTRSRLFGFFHLKHEDEDPVQKAEDVRSLNPEQTIANDELREATLDAIKQLPLRQQQAFVLRAWQGYNVNETAESMGCTQGSVKTHYSRAVNALRQQLEAFRK